MTKAFISDMNPYLSHKEQYFELIEQILDDQLSAEEFSLQFTDLWRKDRDASYGLLDETAKAQEKQLIDNYTNGRLTDEEFDVAWNKFWNIPKVEESYLDLIDGFASACFSLVEVGDKTLKDYEVDETGLKKLVAAHWSSYTTKNQSE
jgi:hypothetical protein